MSCRVTRTPWTRCSRIRMSRPSRFVGSTPIANYIYETGARNGKRVQALGGAKNHLVAMPDADPEKVVDALIGAAYGSAGERCMAISVAVLVGDAADAIMPLLDERAKALQDRRRHGRRYRDGPYRHRAARRAYHGLYRKGRARKARSLCWMAATHVVKGHEGGFFIGAHPLRSRDPRT